MKTKTMDWMTAIKENADDRKILVMESTIELPLRPSDKEALELLERYGNKNSGEVRNILLDALYYLHMIQHLRFTSPIKRKCKVK